MKAIIFVCLAVALILPGAAFAQADPQSVILLPAAGVSSTPATEAQNMNADVQLPTVPLRQRINASAMQLPTLVDRRSPDVGRQLRIPVMIWAASVAADQATTYLFSSRYQGVLRERNPITRGLDQHPALLVAAGSAIDVATGWAARRLLRNHPTLARVVFYGAAAYRTYLAAYNITMMRRAQAMLAAKSGPAVR